MCGKGILTRMGRERGLHTIGIDILHGPDEDIESDLGWEYMITCVMRILAGFLLFSGQECKVLVVANRSRNKRCKECCF